MRLIALSVVLCFVAFCTPMLSQSISINDTGTLPDQSAILDIQSNDKGLLIPRMNSLQRVGINNPVAAGLVVYDIDTKGFWYHDGISWIELVAKNIGSIEDKDGDTKIQFDKSINDNNIRFDVEGDEIMVIDQTGEVEIRSRNINTPGFLSLNNIDTTHFLRLFSGHQTDLDPFFLWKTGTALRFVTAEEDYQDFTEQMRISGNGDITVMGKISNVSDPTSAQDAATKAYVDLLVATIPTYRVGDFAQGGIVFWVDETGQHGLVCAKSDQSGGIRWYAGTHGSTQAKGDGPYSGEANTAIIIAAQVAIGDDGNTYAARSCNELEITERGKTYGDWYLPSKFELN